MPKKQTAKSAEKTAPRRAPAKDKPAPLSPVTLEPPEHSISTLDTLAGTRVHFTQAGLIIGQTLTSDDWAGLLQRLKLIHDAHHNCLADLLRYGRKEFGAEFVAQQLEQMQFNLSDVQRADSIGQLTLDLRSSHTLSSEHYYVLGMKLPDSPKEQEKWAKLAAEHELSPIALKRSLEAEGGPQVITDAQLSIINGRHSGQPVLQGVALEVTRWVNKIGGQDKLARSPEPIRRAFITEIEPIVAIYTQILQTL